MSTHPVEPVCGLSGGGLLTARQRSVAEVGERELAALVRRRWVLSRAQGWAVMSSIGVTFASGLGLGALVRQGWLLAVYVAVLITMSVGVGFMAEAGVLHAFCRLARAYGLSDEAALRVFDRAGQAEPWVEVLRACGTEPSDAQIAQFVRPEGGLVSEAA